MALQLRCINQNKLIKNKKKNDPKHKSFNTGIQIIIVFYFH